MDSHEWWLIVICFLYNLFIWNCGCFHCSIIHNWALKYCKHLLHIIWKLEHTRMHLNNFFPLCHQRVTFVQYSWCWCWIITLFRSAHSFGATVLFVLFMSSHKYLPNSRPISTSSPIAVSTIRAIPWENATLKICCSRLASTNSHFFSSNSPVGLLTKNFRPLSL